MLQGVATRGGNIIGVGGHWGDIIISSPMLRDTRSARALGYCEVAKLSREALDIVSQQYPRSAAIIRQAAIKIAIARSMMVIAMYSTLNKLNKDRKAMLASAHAGGGLAGGLYDPEASFKAVDPSFGGPGGPGGPPLGGLGGVPMSQQQQFHEHQMMMHYQQQQYATSHPPSSHAAVSRLCSRLCSRLRSAGTRTISSRCSSTARPAPQQPLRRPRSWAQGWDRVAWGRVACPPRVVGRGSRITLMACR